ncbi:helix-turn-helix domain-containing protein [Parapedobacter composti]|nr:helix-turn-helix domain-containing protein [Parapedobacter composti]
MSKAMQLFDSNALKECIKDAVREEMHVLISNLRNDSPKKEQTEERLKTKQEMAKELDISLVSLTDWMKKGRIPYRTMGKRVYFKKSEVIEAMSKSPNRQGGRHGK